MARWLPPGSWIGILGGGQLGRMTAEAAHRLGYRVRVLDPEPECPAAQVADVHDCRPYDAEAGRAMGEACAVVTYEFENIPLPTAEAAERVGRLCPSARVLATSRNRLREKAGVEAAGLKVAPYRRVAAEEDLLAAARALGFPILLKTAEGGYDGKGQVLVPDEAALPGAWREMQGALPKGLIAERRVEIVKELSVVGARSADGAVATFPAAENHHRHGILDWSLMPAGVPEEVAKEAQAAVARLLEAWQVVGLLTVEFFWTQEGELLVNETAPRPHNSGHETIEACQTSQYEQLVRAITGLPLGDPRLWRPAALANLLGDLWGEEGPDVAAALTWPVSLHLYGKKEARPGRKMGHLTALGDTPEAALEVALKARRAFAARGVPADEET
jgi:5-(carboxyamino)imidazole ribonucleotide synthase